MTRDSHPSLNRIDMSRRLGELSALIIVAAIAAGLLAKNSSAEPLYDLIHHATVRIGIGPWVSREPLIFWINEGLMVFFFLLIGLELKRELLDGHLSTRRHAVLPACAAAGGMAMPALIYAAFTWSDPASLHGWATPTATDIVLALGVVGLLGQRVPPPVRAFLIALATFDDIGAVLIVGLFYGDGLIISPLIAATIAIAGLWILNRFAIVSVWPYLILGGALWLALLNSGLDAALGGVLIAFAVPMRVSGALDRSPLRSTERAIRPWVALVIVPLFALFNSGISVEMPVFKNLNSPISLGIILGLVVGKQIGIMGASWMATRWGGARLPRGTSWPQIYGISVVSGIGFTMSLFVATLGFESPQAVDGAKLAVLTSSAVSAFLGLGILYGVARCGDSSNATAESSENLR